MRPGRGGAQAGHAVARNLHPAIQVAQVQAKKLGDVVIVLDDQNAARHVL